MLYLRLLVRGDFMAVPFENRNFHKEMLKLAGQLQKEGIPHCFFIVVVQLAAVVV